MTVGPFQRIHYPVQANLGDFDVILGQVGSGSYIKAQLPSNSKINVWVEKPEKVSVTLETEPNKIYCLKTGLQIEFWTSNTRATLEKVDFETCQKEIVDTVQMNMARPE